MLEGQTVIQIFAGTGTIGILGGGFYYLQNNKINQNIEEKEEEDEKSTTQQWVIPNSLYVSKLKTKSSDAPTKELYENEEKNFKCKFTINGTETDNIDCDIFKSDNDDAGKLKNFSNFTTNTKIKKNDLTEDGTDVVFKSKTIDEISDWEQIGDITVKSTKENNKNYGTFSLLYKVNSGNPQGKTNLWITTGNKNENILPEAGSTSEEVEKWYCKEPNASSDTVAECEIFGPKNNTSSPTKATDLKASDFEKIKKIDDFKLNTFYILNLKEKKKNIDDGQKNMSVFLEKTTESAKTKYPVAKLQLFVPLSSEDNFDPATSKPIILE